MRSFWFICNRNGKVILEQKIMKCSDNFAAMTQFEQWIDFVLESRYLLGDETFHVVEILKSTAMKDLK